MKLITIVLQFALLFAITSISNAQSDKLIYEGLDNLYNLKFTEATQNFRKAKTEYPDDIKGYFYETLIPFYTALSTRDEVSYEQFIEMSSDVIKKCDDLLKKNRNNTEALYYKGQSHSHRSLLMLFLNKSLLRAASNGNDGYRILNSVVKNDPAFYDAYMGLGLYKIAIGFVPGKFQWLLSIIGFNGNIREGVNDLEKSMANGKFTRVESKVYLAFFSMREPEYRDEKTIAMLKALLGKYPDSPVFLNLLAGALQQAGRFGESVGYLELALNNNTHALQDAVKKASYLLLGNAYFRANDFTKALGMFEEHLKYVDTEDRYNVSLFTIGTCYEMLGNRQKAVEYYSRVRDDFIEERDGEIDRLFYRYAKDKLSQPMNELDSLQIVGMNLRESGKILEAKEHYQKLLASDIPDRFTGEDDRARIFSEVGYMYILNGNDDMAIDYFTRVSNLKPEKEKWMVPFAFFELGKIYSRKNDRKRADEMFKQALGFKDYDMQQLLEIRLLNFRALN